MTDHITGPGIFFVRSRIAHSAKDNFDEPTFLHWYDDDHIPEVIASSGVNSGFRYLDVNKTSPFGNETNGKPFLAFYPMVDTAFTISKEFTSISVKSDILPSGMAGGKEIWDLADLDVSVLGLGGVTDRVGNAGSGPAKFILTCGVRTSASASQASIAAFIKELMALISEASGHSRTLTFELQHAITNAQTRKAKGLPEVEKCPEPSTWLAMYEFETRPDESVVTKVKEEVGKLESQIGDVDGEVIAWELQRVHGERKLFD